MRAVVLISVLGLLGLVTATIAMLPDPAVVGTFLATRSEAGPPPPLDIAFDSEAWKSALQHPTGYGGRVRNSSRWGMRMAASARLTEGMSEGEVQALLGEPRYADVSGTDTIWTYSLKEDEESPSSSYLNPYSGFLDFDSDNPQPLPPNHPTLRVLFSSSRLERTEIK